MAVGAVTTVDSVTCMAFLHLVRIEIKKGEQGMIVGEGLETQVFLFPYKKSPLGDTHGYVPDTSANVEVATVHEYEDTLVRIFLPNKEAVIVKADQMITAIEKCVKQ